MGGDIVFTTLGVTDHNTEEGEHDSCVVTLRSPKQEEKITTLRGHKLTVVR